MGTRADFYIAKSDSPDGLDWQGSIAWDGYPDGIADAVLHAKTADEFSAALTTFFADRDDVTIPADGWPWPWDDSATTDFGYVLIEGRGVFYCPFGGDVYAAASSGRTPVADVAISYPDMSDRRNVAQGSNRSGVIVVGLR